MNWNLQATLVATVNRGDRAIALNMMPLNGTWMIVVVESAVEKGIANADGLRKLFDDHGHEVLSAPTLLEAIALAEKYAKWWKGSRASHFRCECAEIEPGEAAERDRLLATLPPDELSVARPISEGDVRAFVEQEQLEAATVAKGASGIR